MHIPLLQDLLILLGFSVIVVLILQRFKLPSILGFLLTGIIIGPSSLSLVNAVHEVEIIAEIGVILLLFVIGMELSLKQLASIKKTVFIGGLLQVGITVLVTAAIYLSFGFEWQEAVFVGFLMSLSSTAIVLKVLQDRNEISSPHGRNALGILIFQDLIVVPMMLVTPIMAGNTTDVWMSVLDLLWKSCMVVGVTFISAKYLVPPLMYMVAKTNSKELFLLCTITICFAVAFLTSQAGLSLALGAFLAGLIISESEYSHQATSIILPFRELFTSFFFISVGMLLDLSFFLDHVSIILSLALAVLFVKGSIAAIATAFLKYPTRTTLLTGFALFQVGEFAFILSKVGIENGLLTPLMNQYFLSISIVTMILTPFVILYSGRLSNMIMNNKLKKKLDKIAPVREQTGPAEELDYDEFSGLSDHLVIIGYGINGRNVAKAAKYSNIPYVILELNAALVKTAKAHDEPILYGDASDEHIMETVNVKKARVIVIAIANPQVTKTIISNIRHITQSVRIIVRTRYVKEINTLIAQGADEVIPEEFETSIEIFSRVLQNYLVPLDEMETLVESIRSDNYQMLRPQNRISRSVYSNINFDMKIMCLRVLADSGEIVGKTVADSQIRNKYEVNILAIGRKDEMINHVGPEEKVLQNDKLYVSGDKDHIEKFHHVIT